jgi:hypothetical protein
MSEEVFQIVFRGKILTGFTPEQVQSNLAALFKTDEARIAAQLALPKWVIKAGLSRATAQQVQEKMRALGIMVALVADDNAQAQTSAQTAPIQRVASIGPNAVRPEVQTAQTIQTQPPTNQTAGEAIDQPLARRPEVAAFAADLSAYALADLGAIMDQTTTKSTPKDYDLDQFSLAEVGAVIVQARAVKRIEIDTSAMSLAPVEAPKEELRSSLMREMDG